MDIKSVSLQQVWEMRHSVMYPDEKPETVQLIDDAEGRHLGLYNDAQLVSVISLFERNGDLQFRKFATLTAQQGKGFGTQLLRHVFEQAQTQKMSRIWCNARIAATELYKKFGMRETGSPWSVAGIDFIKMEKLLP